MKKPLLFLVISLFIQNNFCFGQEVDHSRLYIDNVRILKEAQGESNSIPNSVEGSRYINEEFLTGTFRSSSKVYSFRYNAYHDEMEVKNGDEVNAIIKIYNFPITLSVGNKVYQVFDYENNEEKTKGFFVVLTDAKNIKLLLKEEIKFYPEKPAKSGYQPQKAATFKRFVDSHYITYGNNTAEKLPNKKAEFFKIFGNNSEQIKNYIKENKLKYNKTEDLVQIFNYYNGLN